MMPFTFQNTSKNELYGRALELLRDAGLKYTQRRAEIIEIFASEQRYFSASEIHQLLRENYPTMSNNTVYRNLYDFTEIGILEMTELNKEQLFKLSCLNGDHHHHFICRHCDRVIPIHACPITLDMPELKGAKIENHRFELFGLCPTCVTNQKN